MKLRNKLQLLRACIAWRRQCGCRDYGDGERQMLGEIYHDALLALGECRFWRNVGRIVAAVHRNVEGVP